MAFYMEFDGGVNEYDGLVPGSGIGRRCGWHSENPPGIEPPYYRNGLVWLECDNGFTMSGTGCRREGSDHRGDRCAPTTPHPINILTGSKSFRDDDFTTADGAISLVRLFTSRKFGGAGLHIGAEPAGLANWIFDFQYEIHFTPTYSTDKVIVLATPDGELVKFQKQTSGAVTPYTTTARPNAHPDYALEMLDTWPSNPLTTKTHWKMTDAQENVWLLETYQTLGTADYVVARPTQVTTHKGRVVTFTNDSGGKLTSMTDDTGKSVSFTWTVEHGFPKQISQVDLPGGYKLKYTYEPVVAVQWAADRLKKAELTDASNAVLERTSYDYGNSDFPDYVTGVRDKDGTLRWSVAYDTEGRATSSSGPSGADAYTISYSSPGTTFTRTVTNALGKAAIYNFAQSALTTYDTKLVSVNGQASTNCPSSSASTTYNPKAFVASATDEEGRLTQYGRDARGRPLSVIEAAGTSIERGVSLSWNTSLNMPNRIEAPGLTVDYAFQGGSSPGGSPGSYTYAFLGAPRIQIVPSGYTSATVEMWGGAGGNGNYNAGAWSGAGGYVKATFAVSPGDVLKLEIGGGGQGSMRNTPGGVGGWPDGGPGGRGDVGTGGGGGSSRFYINGVLMAVAGGGGGSGGYSAGGSAGAGGGTTGQSATGSGGTGGTQSAVGVDSSATSSANKKGRSLVSFPGTQRVGGFGSDNGDPATSSGDDGGGGGGGYYGGGGGGGDGQSGGGGSSWTHSSATSVTNTAGNVQTPAGSPPTGVALGKNSEVNGNGVAGGDGYAKVDLQ